MRARAFRILCIEDNPDLLDDLVTELRDDGFDVDVAPDGVEGLRRILEGGIHLVFCDIQLPGIDGLCLLRKLGASGRPVPVVVLLTAYGDEETRTKALRLGARAVMVKPIEYDDVLNFARSVGRCALPCQ